MGNLKSAKCASLVQGQHMHQKDDQGQGDFEDAFSPVPHASDFPMILALATQNNMHCDHVDTNQAFVQGDLLPGDGHHGKVYISAPPGFDEDPNYVYQLRRPLYGMPSAARAWHHTMSAYFKSEGRTQVVFYLFWSFICSCRNKQWEPSSTYTLRKVRTIRGCLKGLILMI